MPQRHTRQTRLDNTCRSGTLTVKSLADEIQKLRDLHQSGALNDAEFETAKARIPGNTGCRFA